MNDLTEQLTVRQRRNQAIDAAVRQFVDEFAAEVPLLTRDGVVAGIVAAVDGALHALPPAEAVPAEAIDQIGSVGRRVSHDELMVAQDALGRARDLELAAGNVERAREINQLVLACFMAAIRVEDLEFPDGAS